MSDDQAKTRDAYQAVPYRGGAWLHAAPYRMAALARLHGVRAAPASRSRVLEIGCGDGGHLLPLAIAQPRAEFVGVDLAPRHVEAARARATRLGLDNVRFETGSFADLDTELGRFDYVVAHGLFSWLPEALQNPLLDVAARHLAPEGVFFISYNTFPGWHLRSAVRELLAFHLRGVSDLHERIERGTALLEFLAAHVDDRAPLANTLREVARIAKSEERRSYFAHEYLEEDNHPFFFAEVVERCAARGLVYLANANWSERVVARLPEQTLAGLRAFGDDRVALEQGLDHLTQRMLRQTLFCHATAGPSDTPDASVARELRVASPLRPKSPSPDLSANVLVEFEDSGGRGISLDDPLTKAALTLLGRAWPATIGFDGLVEGAAKLLERRAAPATGDEQTLYEVMGSLFRADLVELHVETPPFATRAGDRPRASALVRLDAAEGHETTNLRHQRVELDDALARHVIAELDGTRDRAALLSALRGELDAAELEEILRLAADRALLVA